MGSPEKQFKSVNTCYGGFTVTYICSVPVLLLLWFRSTFCVSVAATPTISWRRTSAVGPLPPIWRGWLTLYIWSHLNHPHVGQDYNSNNSWLIFMPASTVGSVGNGVWPIQHHDMIYGTPCACRRWLYSYHLPRGLPAIPVWTCLRMEPFLIHTRDRPCKIDLMPSKTFYWQDLRQLCATNTQISDNCKCGQGGTQFKIWIHWPNYHVQMCRSTSLQCETLSSEPRLIDWFTTLIEVSN